MWGGSSCFGGCWSRHRSSRNHGAAQKSQKLETEGPLGQWTQQATADISVREAAGADHRAAGVAALNAAAAARLSALQLALCDLVAPECTPGNLVRHIYKFLGAEARLYGVDGASSPTFPQPCLVLLAGCVAGGVAGGGAAGVTPLIPLVSAPYTPGAASRRAGGSRHPASSEEALVPMLQRAALGRVPVHVRLGGGAAFDASARDPPPPPLPPHHHQAACCAALPLLVAGRLIGVLWISSITPSISSREGGAAAATATAALLTDPTSLVQLAVSATLALSSTTAVTAVTYPVNSTAKVNSTSAAAGCAGGSGGGGSRTSPACPAAVASSTGAGGSYSSAGPHYVCWLAGCLRRLAESSTLHSLVWELREALAVHVHTRFLVDAAVTAALLPQPAARTAFMLHPAGGGNGGDGGEASCDRDDPGLAAAAAAVAAAAGGERAYLRHASAPCIAPSSATASSTGAALFHHGSSVSQLPPVPAAATAFVAAAGSPFRQTRVVRMAAVASSLRRKCTEHSSGDVPAAAAATAAAAAAAVAAGAASTSSGGLLLEASTIVAGDKTRNVAASSRGSHGGSHHRSAPHACLPPRTHTSPLEVPSLSSSYRLMLQQQAGGGRGSAGSASRMAAAAGAAAAAGGTRVVPIMLPCGRANVTYATHAGPGGGGSADTAKVAEAAWLPMQDASGRSLPPGSATAPRGGAIVYAAAAVPSLHAVPLDASDTLLQRMAAAATGTGTARAMGQQGPPPRGGGSGGGSGVLCGPLVSDCARWVLDVHRPARDVFLFMASGRQRHQDLSGLASAAAAFGGGGNIGGGSTGGGGGSGTAPGSPAAAAVAAAAASAPAQSLALVGLEVGGGAVLGLYLAFATQLPPRLLEAVQASCAALLREALVDTVRAKLRGELAEELATLRAGVPGSYAVVPGSDSSRPCSNSSCTPFVVVPTPIAITTVATAATAAKGGGGFALLASQQTAAGGKGGGDTFGGGGGAAAVVLPLPATRVPGPARSVENALNPSERAAALSELLLVNTTTEFPDGGDLDQSAFGAPLMVTLQPVNAVATTTAQQAAAATAAQQQQQRQSAAAAQPTAPLQSQHQAPREAHEWRGRPPATPAAHAVGSPQPAWSAAASLSDVAFTAGVSTSGGAGLMASGGGAGYASWLEMGWVAQQQAPQVPHVAAGCLITVHEADSSSSMRGNLGLLVESITSTMRSSVAAEESRRGGGGGSELLLSHQTVAGGGGGSCSGGGGGRAMLMPDVGNGEDELEDLQLYTILGKGASGVVMQGVLGTHVVAVKVMEMPDVDGLAAARAPAAAVATATAFAAAGPPDGAGGPPPTSAGPDGAASSPEQQARLEAQRAMLRNAMELAVLRSVSHINIVACYALYDNVLLIKVPLVEGMPPSCILRRAPPRVLGLQSPPPGTAGDGSPVCTAIVLELCDCGCLADVLAARTFPRTTQVTLTWPGGTPAATPVDPGGPHLGTAAPPPLKQQTATHIDLWGVYLTLLEIALALRHLHSRRLVHRDLKPANVLLKSNPADPRGWTCKLADFGFALVLDQRCSRQPVAETAPEGGSGVAAATHASPFSSADMWAGRNGVPEAPGISPQRQPGGSNTVWCTVQDVACGTVTHMAPEALRRNARIDGSVDVFAFGVIMWELVCGRGLRPYAKLHPDAIPRAVLTGLRPVFTGSAPATFRDLAQRCWAPEPHLRPRASDLVAAIKSQMLGCKAPYAAHGRQ